MHDNAPGNLDGDAIFRLRPDNFHPDLKKYQQYGDHEEAADELSMQVLRTIRKKQMNI